MAILHIHKGSTDTRAGRTLADACSSSPAVTKPEAPAFMGEQVSVVARLLRKPRAAASGCIVRKPGAHAYTGEPTRTCRDCEMTVAEIEVEGKGGTIIKVKSAALGGVVLAIYTGEGEASAPAIWLENEQAVEELTAAIQQAQGSPE